MNVLELAPQLQDFRPVEHDRVQEMLEKYNWNWEVETKPLFLGNQIATPFLGVVRTENNHCFQTVSKYYEPMQNSELMEIALNVSELTGGEIEVTKSICDGAVTYVSITGRTLKVEGSNVGDVVGEKITLVNSHDGSKSFGIGFGHVILSCTNGMTRFDRKGFVSIRHTSNMRRKLNDAIGGLKKVVNESTSMIEGYKRLMDKPVRTAEIQKVINIVAEIDVNTPADQLSTRKRNIVQSVWDSLTGEMSYKGQTAWGLLNGVTHYTSKIAGKSDSALRSKMFGTAAKKDLSVWDYLIKL